MKPLTAAFLLLQTVLVVVIFSTGTFILFSGVSTYNLYSYDKVEEVYVEVVLEREQLEQLKETVSDVKGYIQNVYNNEELGLPELKVSFSKSNRVSASTLTKGTAIYYLEHTDEFMIVHKKKGVKPITSYGTTSEVYKVLKEGLR